MKNARPLRELPANLKDLAQRAIAVRENAYAVYSKFRVGCALRTTSGKIFVGCNVENASYSAAICAERSTIAQMISAGESQIETLVIAADPLAMPCGVCLQTIREFGPDALIVTLSVANELFDSARFPILFPFPFSL